MEITVYVYILTDANGDKEWTVLKEHNDNISCISGIGSDGLYHQYDGYEGYHLYDWAKQYGMTVDCITKKITL